MERRRQWSPEREEETLLRHRPVVENDPEFARFRDSWLARRFVYLSKRGLFVGIGLNTAALLMALFAYDAANPMLVLTGLGIVEVLLVVWIFVEDRLAGMAEHLAAGMQVLVGAVYALNVKLNVASYAPEVYMIGSTAAYMALSLVFVCMAPLRPSRVWIFVVAFFVFGLAAYWDHPVLPKWGMIHGVALAAMWALTRVMSTRTEQELLLEFTARRLIARAEQIERERDLSLARDIQESLLPPESSTLGSTSIQCFQEKHEAVCGDWLAVRGFADQTTVAVVADATGKGVRAALVVQAVQTLWVDLDPTAPFDAAAWIANVNAVLLKLGAKQPQTMTLGLITISGRSVTYWSAGHIPLFVKERGPGGSVTCRMMVARGGMLGVMEKVSLSPLSFSVPPGSAAEVMLASDGLFDRGTRYTAADLAGFFDQLATHGAKLLRIAGARDDRSLIHVRIDDAAVRRDPSSSNAS